MSSISQDKENQLKIVTVISAPTIESAVIHAFVQANWKITKRLFNLKNFDRDLLLESILILTPDLQGNEPIHALWIVGIGAQSDPRWKQFNPSLIISPAEIHTLPMKVLRMVAEVNSEELIIGAKEILFLGTKGSPGTSTLAWNFAGELARSGEKTLLAEVDSRGAEAAIFFGFEDQTQNTILFPAITIRPNYDLLCNPLIQEAGENITPLVWKNFRKKAQERYGQIVIDGGAYDFMKSIETQSFLINRAEKIFLVGQNDLFSIPRLMFISTQLAKMGKISLVSIFINKFEANAKVRRLVAEQLSRTGVPEILFLPREDQIFIESSKEGALLSEMKSRRGSNFAASIRPLH